MSARAYDRLSVSLAAAGLGISAYLTLLHYDSDVPLVCSAGSFVNCESVLTSASSIALGVPVAVWGLLWFVVALGLALVSLRYPLPSKPAGLPIAGLAWALVGTVAVLWLVYQEVGIVGRLCAWCTAVHVIVLALLVVAIQQADRATGRA